MGGMIKHTGFDNFFRKINFCFVKQRKQTCVWTVGGPTIIYYKDTTTFNNNNRSSVDKPYSSVSQSVVQ